jgi:hypothetical protein
MPTSKNQINIIYYFQMQVNFIWKNIVWCIRHQNKLGMQENKTFELMPVSFDPNLCRALSYLTQFI